MNIPHWIVPVKRLVLSDQVGKWCQLPYPNHPQGCPNYAYRLKCPPYAPHISYTLDLGQDLYLVHSEFDLTAHKANMKVKHPEWTDRQLGNVLYWQPKSRQQLMERIHKVSLYIKGRFRPVLIPEAQGVNIFATCAVSGLKLDKINDLKIVRHVALLGRSKSILWSKE